MQVCLIRLSGLQEEIRTLPKEYEKYLGKLVKNNYSFHFICLAESKW